MVECIKLKPVDEFSAPTGLAFTEDCEASHDLSRVLPIDV